MFVKDIPPERRRAYAEGYCLINTLIEEEGYWIIPHIVWNIAQDDTDALTEDEIYFNTGSLDCIKQFRDLYPRIYEHIVAEADLEQAHPRSIH